MRAIDIFTLLSVIVGGLTSGLVGLAQVDLVAAPFSAQVSAIAQPVCLFAGAAAVWHLLPLSRARTQGKRSAEVAA